MDDKPLVRSKCSCCSLPDASAPTTVIPLHCSKHHTIHWPCLKHWSLKLPVDDDMAQQQSSTLPCGCNLENGSMWRYVLTLRGELYGDEEMDEEMDMAKEQEEARKLEEMFAEPGGYGAEVERERKLRRLAELCPMVADDVREQIAAMEELHISFSNTGEGTAPSPPEDKDEEMTQS